MLTLDNNTVIKLLFNMVYRYPERGTCRFRDESESCSSPFLKPVLLPTSNPSECLFPDQHSILCPLSVDYALVRPPHLTDRKLSKRFLNYEVALLLNIRSRKNDECTADDLMALMVELKPDSYPFYPNSKDNRITDREKLLSFPVEILGISRYPDKYRLLIEEVAGVYAVFSDTKTVEHSLGVVEQKAERFFDALGRVHSEIGASMHRLITGFSVATTESRQISNFLIFQFLDSLPWYPRVDPKIFSLI